MVIVSVTLAIVIAFILLLLPHTVRTSRKTPRIGSSGLIRFAILSFLYLPMSVQLVSKSTLSNFITRLFLHVLFNSKERKKIMHRKTIKQSRGNAMFRRGDRVHVRNISGAPMRGGIRL